MMNTLYYQGADGQVHCLGDQNYLEHHGVPGMRWGFRKRPERALQSLYKRDKKANKLLIKSGSYMSKSARQSKKANKMRAKAVKNIGTDKEAKYERKAKAYEKKANRYQNKAGKAMSKSGKMTSNAAKFAEKMNKYDGALSAAELKKLKARHLYVGRKYAVKYLG